MKILALSNHPYVIFKFRYELFLSLLNDKNDVIISCPYDNNLDKLIDKGCKLMPVDIDRHSINPFKELYVLLFYYRLIKRLNPGIILTYTIKPNIYGGIVASSLKIPYISTITGLGTLFNRKNSLLKAFALIVYRFALRCSKYVVFQNKNNLDYMVNRHIVRNNAVLVNGSGVNTEQFSYIPYPANREKVVLLFIGRLMKDKGIFELYQAAQSLYDDGCVNLRVKVIGFCESDFKKRLESLPLPPNIELCGYQDDVKSFIAAAHAVVLPSYHEGMSNSLLEAASCGRPLIASNIPGCREIIDDGRTGFLCEPRSAESLASAIRRFLALSAEEKREMGIAAREKVVRSFDRETIVAKYKELIYEERQ